MVMDKRKPRPKPQARKIDVFLVDDHAIARLGLAALLNQQANLRVCGEATTQAEAQSAIPKARPDLVITDITLGRGNGMELIRNLVSQDQELNVLVFSMHEESLYAEMALHAGARGYVMKQAAVDHLLEAVQGVLAGRIYLSHEMTSQLLQKRQLRQKPTSDPIERLSHRERQVFQLIAQWVPTKEIAQQLSLSVKTVEYYRYRIKEKLRLRTAAELTHYCTEWARSSG